jgi:type II secretory ATPase GspE/PulE/Tfp pilus assembly ATPase PilB-like protein
MGVGASDIASGTNCFIAQRLARKLCSNCKKKKKLSEEEKKEIKEALNSISGELKIDKNIPEYIFEAVGCPKCKNIGYEGRIPVSEILQIDKEMEKYLTEMPTTSEIEEKAIEKGMITMYQDGILKVLSGETSLDEIHRVTGEE